MKIGYSEYKGLLMDSLAKKPHIALGLTDEIREDRNIARATLKGIINLMSKGKPFHSDEIRSLFNWKYTNDVNYARQILRFCPHFLGIAGDDVLRDRTSCMMACRRGFGGDEVIKYLKDIEICLLSFSNHPTFGVARIIEEHGDDYVSKALSSHEGALVYFSERIRANIELNLVVIEKDASNYSHSLVRDNDRVLISALHYISGDDYGVISAIPKRKINKFLATYIARNFSVPTSAEPYYKACMDHGDLGYLVAIASRYDDHDIHIDYRDYCDITDDIGTVILQRRTDSILEQLTDQLSVTQHEINSEGPFHYLGICLMITMPDLLIPVVTAIEMEQVDYLNNCYC